MSHTCTYIKYFSISTSLLNYVIAIVIFSNTSSFVLSIYILAHYSVTQELGDISVRNMTVDSFLSFIGLDIYRMERIHGLLHLG